MPNNKGLIISALGCALVMLLSCLSTRAAEVAAKKPSVLFTTGLHRDYFTLPMHAEGIELDTCGVSELPARLKSGKYNVVYVTGGFDQPAIVTALKDFMAAGGGVLVCYTHSWDQEKAWEKRQDFLQEYGAHFAWVELKENDPTLITPSSFHMTLVQTDQIAAPFNKGVSSLLYFHLPHVAGAPVTPLVMDGNWTPIVRGSSTSEAAPADDVKLALLRRYLPKEPFKSPVFLASRPVGAGRLAAFGMAPEWVMSSPGNCPPVKEMMTTGTPGHPSNWVRVLANTFRWLSEPTLVAGKGGEPTPASLLESKKSEPRRAALRDWAKAPEITDQEQIPGLVGAQSQYSGGKGTVAEWAAAAKAAGLKFLVFLDPLDKISREDYAKLQHDCAAASDDTFFACPGLRYQDVYTKTNAIAYGETVEYPHANLLTADGKYFNNATDDKKLYRSRHLFDYVLEQNNYHGEYGYFRHAVNPTPPWEYKLYSLFTIYSTEKGKPVDNNFNDYAELQAMRLNLTPLSISLMEQPADIAAALKRDWLVVNTAPGEFGDGSYSEEFGTGVAATRKLFKELIAWFRPFQYITQGPRILCWRDRWPVAIDYTGEWFRPDMDRYRVRLHVASDVGLKEIRIMSMGKVLQRYLPNGAKDFDRTMEFENIQQRDMYPVIEDMAGKRAIGMVSRNTTTRWTEFICGDRCNFLNYGWELAPDGSFCQFRAGGGNSVTHNKGNWRVGGTLNPADTLTSHSATLPTDGAPVGLKSTEFNIVPSVDTPGFPTPTQMNSRPHPVLASPDAFIGGGTLNMVETDPTGGEGAWEFFGPIKENEWIEGGSLTTTFHPQIDGLRAGWVDMHTKTRKAMPLGPAKLAVQFTTLPFTELRDGEGKVYAAGSKDLPPVGSFKTGAYVLQPDDGGVTAVLSLDDNLRYEIAGKDIRIGLQMPGHEIPPGTELNIRLGYVGGAQSRTLDDLRHYIAMMSKPLPGVKITRGKLALMDGLSMHLDAARESVEMKISPLNLDGYLPVVIENTQPNWDIWLLDRSRNKPNWRQIPKVDATAYASLPSNVAQQLFIGPPVVATSDDLHISLCNLLPGQWLVSLHNPTDQAIKATVRSLPNWSVFKLPAKEYTVPAGSSVDIPVKGE